MRLGNIARIQEWWSAIIPPIFLMYYIGTYTHCQTIAFNYYYLILMGIVSVFTAFVGYIINDITDIADDARAGKKNFMAGMAMPVRYLLCIIIVLSLLISILVAILSNTYSIERIISILYLLNILCFLIYSLPPLRLKRNIWFSVLLDATYSGTLFYIVAFSLGAGYSFTIFYLMKIIIAWGILKGIRNFLTHIVLDCDNDRKAGIRTLAVAYNPKSIQLVANIIYPLELVMLFYLCNMGLVYYILMPLFVITMLYFIFCFIKNKHNNIPHLNDIYELWLPLLYLILLAKEGHYLVAIIHYTLFPNHLLTIYFRIKNTLFKIFGVPPKSIREIIHGIK